MAKYASQSISGYNASPPSDDASQTDANTAKWGDHVIAKVGDPITAQITAVQSQLATAFGRTFLDGVSAKTTTYSVVAGDWGNLLVCSGTFTVTLLAAATATAGFTVALYNSGSTPITIDGTTSETINGNTTILLGAKDYAVLVCDGSTWYAHLTRAGTGCMVYLDANQSINNLTDTAIAFDQESFDDYAIHDNATNNSRLTVPAGVTRVRLTAKVAFASSTAGLKLAKFTKNGADTYAGHAESSTAPAPAGTLQVVYLPVASPVLAVAGGDYFELEAYHEHGSALNVIGDANGENTWFAMDILN